MHGRVGRRAQEVLKGPLWGVGVHLLICFLGMCIVEVEDGARSRSRQRIVKAESFCTSSWAGWAVAIVMHTLVTSETLPNTRRTASPEHFP